MPDNVVPYQGKHPQIHVSVYVDPSARLMGDVIVREGASIWPGAVLRGDDGPVEVGQGSAVLEHCVLEVPSGQKLVVGRGVLVSHGAIIHGALIGDHSLVGIGAIILDGAQIGDNCLIGAGAVIPPGTMVPPGKLVLGIPGRVVRDVTEIERANLARELEGVVKKAAIYKAQNFR